jgi:hypothetical protein
MKRRLTYALAGLALLLSVAAGAVAAEVDGVVAIHVIRNDDGTDSVAPPPALAGFKTRSGGTEVSISRPLRITPGVVLAGFNSTKMGTEVAY